MKLSIILCVYNTKIEYVKQCLDSIFSSTAENYEIIFVDDGSEIDYSDIISEPRIKYVKTENRGLLRARLVGIENASGKYVAFVDSDDKISKNYHRPMIDAAERTGADIVFNDWSFDFGEFKNYPTRDSTICKTIDCTGEQALTFYTSQQGREQSYFVQWNKLFSRELLLNTVAEIMKTDIPSMKITYAEDVIFNFFNFKNAKRIINIHTGFYFYRIHAGQSVSVNDFSKLKWQIDSMVYAFSLMHKSLLISSDNLAVKNNLSKWKAHMARYHFGCAKALNDKNAQDYVIKSYGINNLTPPRKKDGKAYKGIEFIGKNFKQTDDILTELYYADAQSVCYTSHAKYIRRFISYIKEYKSLGLVPSKKGENKKVVLKNETTFKQKIISSAVGSSLYAFYCTIKKLFIKQK